MMNANKSLASDESASEAESSDHCTSRAKVEDWSDLRQALKRDWDELRMHGGRWAAANCDLLLYKSGRVAAYVIAVGFAILTASTICVTAVVYGIRGSAEALSQLLAIPRWAGDLTTALILLATMTIVLLVGVRRGLFLVEQGLRRRYMTRCRSAEPNVDETATGE